MELCIRRTYVEEAQDILAVQKEAFREDLERYKDHKTNPANEPIEKLIYKINKNHHYTILIDDIIIGGAEVRLDSEDECYINRIFLSPEYQDSGFGSQIMIFLETEYPSVKKWTLSTPHLNYRNHHFYEKFGFKKVGEHCVTENLSLIDYLKECN